MRNRKRDIASGGWNQVILQLISFFGSMGIRDAVVMQTKVNPDINHLKKLLDPIRSLKVEIIEPGTRSPGS